MPGSTQSFLLIVFFSKGLLNYHLIMDEPENLLMFDEQEDGGLLPMKMIMDKQLNKNYGYLYIEDIRSACKLKQIKKINDKNHGYS